MTNLALAALLNAAIVGIEADTYGNALRQSAETGQPMVVMVGAQWCGACRSMKKNVLPEVQRHGALNQVNFAMVDLDDEHELGRKLIGGGPIPQLLMFRKTHQGWLRRKLIGAQSPQAVEAFIRQGIEPDEPARQAEAIAQSAPDQRTGALAARNSWWDPTRP